MDIKDEQERQKCIKELVSEFCSMCKSHCIDIVENTIFTQNENGNNKDSQELPKSFERVGIEFMIIGMKKNIIKHNY